MDNDNDSKDNEDTSQAQELEQEESEEDNAEGTTLLLLPCGMTLFLTYIVSNLLVLLKKLYFPFSMCPVIMYL